MISTSRWLVALANRAGAAFDSFEVYMFEGTLQQLRDLLDAWQRPDGVSVTWLRVAEQILGTHSQDEARKAMAAAFQELAGDSTRSIVVIDGVHLLAWLYGDGFMGEIYRWLRRGSRAVVMVTPPRPQKRIPTSAALHDWRRVVSAEVGPERVVGQGA